MAQKNEEYDIPDFEYEVADGEDEKNDTHKGANK